jgi:hypothetical protein
LFVGAGHASAATYYVSFELGDDTRTSVQAQSSTTPWKNHPDSNLATSNSASMKTNFAPGDKIILRKGEVWWDTQLTSGKSGTGPADNQLITTTTEDGFGTGANPIIAGAALLNGIWTDTGVNGEYKISLATQPYMVYNGDTELLSGTPGSLDDNGFGWLADELYVKIGSDPSGGNIQAAKSNSLWIISDYRAYSNLDLRYSNNGTAGVIYAISRTGIILSKNNISRGYDHSIRLYNNTNPVIANNTIEASSNSLLYGAGHKGASIYISNGNIGGSIYGNTISGGYFGIEAGNSMSIYSNKISNAYRAIYVTGNSNLIYSNILSSCHNGFEITGNNNLIHNNEISNNWNGIEYPGGTGNDLSISGAASGNTVRDNYFHGGYVSTVLGSTSGTGNNEVIYNIFRDFHVNGVYVGTGGTTENPDLLTNNIFIHNPTAGNPPGSIGHAIVITAAGTHSYECTHANIKNNLFVGETAGAEMISIDEGLALYASGDMDQIDIDYNYYWQKNAGAEWRFTDKSGNTTDFAVWKSDLSEENVTGADANSINILSTGQSPFVDIDGNNFLSQSQSPAIDTGTDVSLTTDYAGNSIYGLPDIGGYEYQPPYTVGTTPVPTSGSIRIYSDNKYRALVATTTATTIPAANFSVTPVGGFYTASTSQYMDITIDSWLTSGTKNKQWTATSSIAAFNTHATSTVYTIGDLLPSTYYNFSLDSVLSPSTITGDTCNANGSCLSDANGSVTFTYTGGYSTHTFALTKDTTAPAAFTLTAPANNDSIVKYGTLSWVASSDSESGLAPYQLYIDNALALSTTDTSTSAPLSVSCGSAHSWYVKALDNNGNSTNSDTRSFSIGCSFSHTYPRIIPVVATTTPVTATPALPSATLSSAQVSSILAVLASFNVDADTMTKVQNALTGTALTPSTDSGQTGFARDLKLNATGNDVKQLQQFLNTHGFTVSATGAGSLGNETTKFGALTKAALIRFQKANNITPAVGYFGPLTREAINSSR